ncbi:hypothetical protein [Streptomyces sp. TRM70350]|uniref:hypothetical protein n=1 Tax=Streptomyces sp. TRM70350 TaxID=2856165 RepID=UPI001C48F143|nr:hypothetical protein [Streptomyces sp. TRM70350]MBV7697778.1 hypothetical protein [Streptomyces sp. TRM70350]
MLLVEDTSTTGASTLAAAATVRSEGAHVAGVVRLVDCGGASAITKADMPVRSMLTAADHWSDRHDREPHPHRGRAR